MLLQVTIDNVGDPFLRHSVRANRGEATGPRPGKKLFGWTIMHQNISYHLHRSYIHPRQKMATASLISCVALLQLYQTQYI